jgi:3-phenylpropionate/trans-cinnamate dioxygenase ferredoxin reductase subunit
MSPKIIAIGGGPAAVFAALEAKRVDPAADVTLVSDENCEPYEKPPLSKAVLLGNAKAEDALIAGRGGLAQRGVNLRLATRCTVIDRASKIIHTTTGSLPYDSLVIATGSRIRELPAFPKGTPCVHYLRTSEDARVLKAALSHGAHLVVVGAGLIGLEGAASAAALGLQVTVVEAASRPMSRTCDEDTAARILAEHKRHGVQFELARSILRSAAEPDRTLTIELDNGMRLTCQAVLVGAGVIPDDALARAAGLDVKDGILVDAQCRTSDPSIFAAGDVTRLVNSHDSRATERLENWRHAQDQGAVAGRNAAGNTDRYAPLPSYWSEQYDLYIQGVGRPIQDAQRVSRTSENSSVSFEVKNGIVHHAVGINAQKDMAVIRRLIERRILVDSDALGDPARPLGAMLKAAPANA